MLPAYVACSFVKIAALTSSITASSSAASFKSQLGLAKASFASTVRGRIVAVTSSTNRITAAATAASFVQDAIASA